MSLISRGADLPHTPSGSPGLFFLMGGIRKSIDDTQQTNLSPQVSLFYKYITRVNRPVQAIKED
jgi:hypothetical protein